MKLCILAQLICRYLQSIGQMTGAGSMWLRAYGLGTGESFFFLGEHQCWSAVILSVSCAACWPVSSLYLLLFFFPVLLHTHAWVFHVHGGRGMWSMCSFRHCCVMLTWSAAGGLQGTLFILIVCRTVNWSKPGRYRSCVNNHLCRKDQVWKPQTVVQRKCTGVGLFVWLHINWDHTCLYNVFCCWYYIIILFALYL